MRGKTDIENILQVANKICAVFTNQKNNGNTKFTEHVLSELEEMRSEDAKENRKQLILIIKNNCIFFECKNIFK